MTILTAGDTAVVIQNIPHRFWHVRYQYLSVMCGKEAFLKRVRNVRNVPNNSKNECSESYNVIARRDPWLDVAGSADAQLSGLTDERRSDQHRDAVLDRCR